MDDASEFARDYIENLLTFFGLNIDVEVEENDGVVAIQVPSTHLNGFLIGQHGDNLRALQYLLNMALRNAGHEEATVTLDVAGYKEQRAQRLTKETKRTAETVLKTGESQRLKPMNAYERRVAHQAVAEIDGVMSESEGEGRGRRVVIKAENTTQADEEE